MLSANALPASPTEPSRRTASLWALLRETAWPAMRHAPGRTALVCICVALGVALSFSVQLINDSALGEFASALHQVNGEPDFTLRAQREGFDETLYTRVALHPDVAWASPVIEWDVELAQANGARVSLRLIGLDALAAAPITPALVPQPNQADRVGFLAPDAVFLNPAAERLVKQLASHREPQSDAQQVLEIPLTGRQVALRIAGSVSIDGPPLAVLDIAGAQVLLGWGGRLSRIDVRLRPGVDADALVAALALPPGVRAARANEGEQRMANLSQAYRVNLSVLALVALFTGAFLVFSIFSLTVAQRTPQFALLGVLGLTANERLRLVLAEAALLGLIGSVCGLVIGAGLAAFALRWLAGDLGGGVFTGIAPELHIAPIPALLVGALGVLAAVAGAWLPARRAQRLAPALALKGLGGDDSAPPSVWWAAGPVLAGLALLPLPPVGGLPIAAYLSVALLLLGGVAAIPLGVGGALALWHPQRAPLMVLAVERARHQRSSATIAVAGVVTGLALSVALTTMVGSFRSAVGEWLGGLLAADLYVQSAASSASANALFFTEEAVAKIAALPGVAHLEAQRIVSLQLAPEQPAVVLIARPLHHSRAPLPLIGAQRAPPPGAIAIWVSEPFAELYRVTPGDSLTLPLGNSTLNGAVEGSHPMPGQDQPTAFARATTDFSVAGIWRDYARQFGAIAIDIQDFRARTHDSRSNDLALWLAPGTARPSLQESIRAVAGPGLPMRFASADEIRSFSLRIFDRSFAVTTWLQMVAMGIGLFGVAASFSAQVLARKREFGLLAHLGLTRRQILTVVAAEGAAWTFAGVLLGLVLGVVISAVLVKVVNPQSFHWSMDLQLPWGQLLPLCLAMLAAGTLAASIAGRAAANANAALAVKEDW